MILEAAFQISKNVIIMGNLNEDLLNSTFHNLKDIIIVNSMMNVINIPTRGNALLDPILITSDLEYSGCGTFPLPQAISDHCATYISIPFPYQTQPCFERNIWLYKRANYELLNQKVSDYNRNVLLNGSVDESCATFTRIFIEIVNQCIPHKTVCFRPDDQPWYDNAIRRISRNRDRIKRTPKASRKITDWSKYENLRYTVNNMEKHAKERFFNNLETNLLALNCNDKRGFWKIIKHFLKQETLDRSPDFLRLLLPIFFFFFFFGRFQRIYKNFFMSVQCKKPPFTNTREDFFMILFMFI